MQMTLQTNLVLIESLSFSAEYCLKTGIGAPFPLELILTMTYRMIGEFSRRGDKCELHKLRRNR
jgi:hypothetical protein